MYEDELYNIFIEETRKMYGIKEEDKIYKYLYIRYLISNLEKERKEIETKFDLSKFLLNELNIDILDNNYFTYKEQKISIVKTLYNIIENLEFRASLSCPDEIFPTETTLALFLERAYYEIMKYAYNKSKKIKNANNDVYNIYLKYYALKELNFLFKAHPSHPSELANFFYTVNHNPFKRSLEEEIEGFIHSIKFKSQNVFLIEERDVEEYIKRNIEKVEKGMKYIDCQVSVECGRIDILAKDRDNVYVVIEIKVEEDKEIIWQCMYYPDEIRKKLNIDKVRMITLCPNYETHILKVLRKIDYVEIMRYKPYLSLNKIQDIDVYTL